MQLCPNAAAEELCCRVECKRVSGQGLAERWNSRSNATVVSVLAPEVAEADETGLLGWYEGGSRAALQTAFDVKSRRVAQLVRRQEHG